MTQHVYTYDIKMFAIIRVRATDKKDARKLARLAVDLVHPEFPSADEALKSAIIEASVHMDDEGGPYLIEIDGEEVDSCGQPI